MRHLVSKATWMALEKRHPRLRSTPTGKYSAAAAHPRNVSIHDVPLLSPAHLPAADWNVLVDLDLPLPTWSSQLGRLLEKLFDTIPDQQPKQSPEKNPANVINSCIACSVGHTQMTELEWLQSELKSDKSPPFPNSPVSQSFHWLLFCSVLRKGAFPS